jgi:hypothetical protein
MARLRFWAVTPLGVVDLPEGYKDALASVTGTFRASFQPISSRSEAFGKVFQLASKRWSYLDFLQWIRDRIPAASGGRPRVRHMSVRVEAVNLPLQKSTHDEAESGDAF